jgi:probable rRNA maturation factor
MQRPLRLKLSYTLSPALKQVPLHVRKLWCMPSRQTCQQWITPTVFSEQKEDGPKTISLFCAFVHNKEIQAMNHQYRHKNATTNILSFPAPRLASPQKECCLLGELLLAPDIIYHEAQVQEKNLEGHWAHLIIHGTLHLLGYDHLISRDADIMENKEIALLHAFGYANPYTPSPTNRRASF